MKRVIFLVAICFLFQTWGASWTNKKASESIYAQLADKVELKTFFMKKKKDSEYFINSLKQLTYRTFWSKKVVGGSVDIEEVPVQDLEFIMDRELTNLTMEDLKTNLPFSKINFYLGTHEEANASCINLLMFEPDSKEAAIYSECTEF